MAHSVCMSTSLAPRRSGRSFGGNNPMKTTVSCWLQILWAIPTIAQSGFVNLDFEQGVYVPFIPEAPHAVAISNALPGWSACWGGSEVALVSYNDGGPGITLFGPPPEFGFTAAPFHGSYSVAINAAFPGMASSIYQSGQVPSNAKSLIFYVYLTEIEVGFAGQPITLYDTGGVNGPNSYHKYIGDISAFAGQTGELRFSAYGGNLDFIQFSAEPIPEPAVPCQMVVGLIGLICVRRTRRQMAQPTGLTERRDRASVNNWTSLARRR